MIYRLKLALLLVVLHNVSADDDVPPVPSPPKNFQVEYQITMEESRTTTSGRVFYDGSKERGEERGALYRHHSLKDVIQSPMLEVYNYKGTKHQHVTIEIDSLKCTVAEDHTELTEVFEFSFMKGGVLGLVENLEYVDSKTVIMGVQSNYFKAENVKLPGSDDFYTVETYWSVYGSTSFPNCPDQNSCENWSIPLQTNLTKTGGDSTFVNVYTYYNYREDKVTGAEFQIPPGAFCDITSSKPFPNWNYERYSAVIERVPTEGPVVKEQVYFDGVERMARIDGASLLTPNSTSGMMFLTSIYDFGRGVNYYIDDAKEICYPPMEIKKDIGSNGLNFLVFDTIDPARMVYVGKRPVDTMSCGVWVTQNKDVTIEIYMVQMNVLEVDEAKSGGKVKAGEVERWVPVIVNMTTISEKAVVSSVLLRIFNFQGPLASLDSSIFDITSCYTDGTDIMNIQIEFKLCENCPPNSIKDNEKQFIALVRSQIVSFAGIAAIRIQDIKLDYVETTSKSQLVVFSAKLIEDILNSGIKPVSERMRQVPAKTPTNKEAYNALEEATNERSFKVSIQGMAPEMIPIEVTAQAIREIPVTTVDSSILKVEFTGKGAKTLLITSSNKVLKNWGVIDCAQECLRLAENGECETFSSCTDKGTCRISSTHFNDLKEDQYKDDSRCQMYTRSYTLDYIVSLNTKTKPTSDETTTVQGKTAEECAQMCSNKNNGFGFFCEGFDYCGENNICSFRSRHILQIPPEEVFEDANCKHYTRDYSQDYLLHPDQTIKNRPMGILDTAVKTVEDCAFLCSTFSDPDSCKAFEMSGSTHAAERTECTLFVYPKAHGEVYKADLKSDGLVDHYSREHFSRRDTYPTTSPSTNSEDDGTTSPSTNSEDDGYSSGSMAGLGIGMLLVGFLLGGIIMAAIIRYKLFNVNRSLVD